MQRFTPVYWLNHVKQIKRVKIYIPYWLKSANKSISCSLMVIEHGYFTSKLVRLGKITSPSAVGSQL